VLIFREVVEVLIGKSSGCLGTKYNAELFHVVWRVPYVIYFTTSVCVNRVLFASQDPPRIRVAPTNNTLYRNLMKLLPFLSYETGQFTGLCFKLKVV
jgi:hypothetical protein